MSSPFLNQKEIQVNILQNSLYGTLTAEAVSWKEENEYIYLMQGVIAESRRGIIFSVYHFFLYVFILLTLKSSKTFFVLYKYLETFITCLRQLIKYLLLKTHRFRDLP